MERRFTFGEAVQYPVTMELKYKIRSRWPRVGTGQTRWMSRDEVAFTADQPIEPGAKVEVSMAWPVLLMERTALQLVVEGEVTRCQGNLLTARIARHQFRTRSWNRPESVEVPAGAPFPGAIPLQRQEAASVM